MKRLCLLGLAMLLIPAVTGRSLADDKADPKKVAELLKDLKGSDAAKKRHAAVSLGGMGMPPPRRCPPWRKC